MKYEDVQEFECPKCGKKLQYNESMRGTLYLDDECVAAFSHDCHGITFRQLCLDCLVEIEDTIGYDGEYYTELDECIDDYY